MKSTETIHSSPGILFGTAVFVGTRVPFQTLIDYIEQGSTLDEFLDHFPSVTRAQAIAALDLAKDSLAHARRANRRLSYQTRLKQ